VVYQTGYSSSHCKSRHLTPEELGNSFGLPMQLSLGGLEVSMFPSVLLQVLVGCLDSLSQSNSPLLKPLTPPAHQSLAEAVPTSTWLLSSKSGSIMLGSIIRRCRQKLRKVMALEFQLICGTSVSYFRSLGCRGLPLLCSSLMRFQPARLHAELRDYMAATHGAD
jgi:hypothetical protein